MGKVSTIVGKMPFAGRAIVENAALTAIGERTSMKEKLAKCAGAAGFLAIFAVMHGVQAKMGITDFDHDINSFAEDPNMQDGLEMGISGLYTLANAAVTYTQFSIAGRVARNYWRFRQGIESGERHLTEEDYAFETQTVTPLDIACTLGGQILFMTQRDV